MRHYWYCYQPFDLHVLGLPLAFILSQDQTLHCKILCTHANMSWCQVLTLLTYWRYGQIRFAWFVSLCFFRRRSKWNTYYFVCFRHSKNVWCFHLRHQCGLVINPSQYYLQYFTRFGSAKVANFPYFQSLKRGKLCFFCFPYQAWALAVEAGCKGTVAFFGFTRDSINKFLSL